MLCLRIKKKKKKKKKGYNVHQSQLGPHSDMPVWLDVSGITGNNVNLKSIIHKNIVFEYQHSFVISTNMYIKMASRELYGVSNYHQMFVMPVTKVNENLHC